MYTIIFLLETFFLLLNTNVVQVLFALQENFEEVVQFTV